MLSEKKCLDPTEKKGLPLAHELRTTAQIQIPIPNNIWDLDIKA